MAALFIQDSERRVMSTEEGLRNLYALTPAEARLAAILTEGVSLRTSAERLGITFQTARDHLKRILSKTQTSRQSELMRLILQGPTSFARFRSSKKAD
jgi:DNA-binding CsgD family transcriptional regulator